MSCGESKPRSLLSALQQPWGNFVVFKLDEGLGKSHNSSYERLTRSQFLCMSRKASYAFSFVFLKIVPELRWISQEFVILFTFEICRLWNHGSTLQELQNMFKEQIWFFFLVKQPWYIMIPIKFRNYIYSSKARAFFTFAKKFNVILWTI